MTAVAVSVWSVDLLQPISVVDAVRAGSTTTRSARPHRGEMTYCAIATWSRTAPCARSWRPGSASNPPRSRSRGDAPAAVTPRRKRRSFAGGGTVSFSLSHSGVARGRRGGGGATVGVDIEIERPRARLDALAARVLSAEEYSEWLDAEPPDRGRVPTAVDSEGGVPQGHRCRDHTTTARRAAPARRLDGRADSVPARDRGERRR